MERKIDKFDIRLLCIMYNKEITSALDAIQIQEIIDLTKFDVAYFTMAVRLKKLVTKGLIEEGYKQRNAKTYFISKEGIATAIKLIEEGNIVFEEENNNEGEE